MKIFLKTTIFLTLFTILNASIGYSGFLLLLSLGWSGGHPIGLGFLSFILILLFFAEYKLFSKYLPNTKKVKLIILMVICIILFFISVSILYVMKEEISYKLEHQKLLSNDSIKQMEKQQVSLDKKYSLLLTSSGLSTNRYNGEELWLHISMEEKITKKDVINIKEWVRSTYKEEFVIKLQSEEDNENLIIHYDGRDTINNCMPYTGSICNELNFQTKGKYLHDISYALFDYNPNFRLDIENSSTNLNDNGEISLNILFHYELTEGMLQYTVYALEDFWVQNMHDKPIKFNIHIQENERPKYYAKMNVEFDPETYKQKIRQHNKGFHKITEINLR